MLDDDLQGLLNKAFFYLKFRLRTVAESRRYLYKKIRTTHWSHEAADKVIDYLLEIELLDDKKFINWFVDQRNSGRPKGEYVLRQELRKYGIEKDLIDDFFNNNPVDEEKLAEKVLSSRWSRFKDLPLKIRFQKASQFLMRKGFKFETAKRIIANFITKE